MAKYSGLQLGVAGASLALVSSALLIWLVQSKKVDEKERRTKSKRRGGGAGENQEDSETTPPLGGVLEFDDDDDDEKQRADTTTRVLTPGCVTIVHASVTGTTTAFAKAMTVDIETRFPRRTVQLVAMDDIDWWDELLNNEQSADEAKGIPVLLIFLPTYTNGSWTPTSGNLKDALDDLRTDWRIAKFPLRRKLRVAVFGMGSSEYDDGTMGQPAREAVSLFNKLGAKVAALAVGDDATANHANEAFHKWKTTVLSKFFSVVTAENSQSSSSCCGASDDCEHHKADDKNEQEEEEVIDEDYESDVDQSGEPGVIDVEDMGDAIAMSSKTNTGEPREMVTPSQAAALKKEGYKLIGSHSAVKLCRWTKHQLRGRGGCYKHTFYGITSYQCMEATPSLACANKCVFCWRHHKNPVGKEWRWKTDEPDFIVDEAVKTHIQMIKETKGIPGVKYERWKEAHTVRHCALSLVGEPIMYPKINELLGELHHRQISTFLVTNGQHPSAIHSLRPVTQLYVSVDAPTKESLIAIDRPLFSDAWERLRQSLVGLKTKGQRTVARLTVVKGWNSDEVSGYAELIALGRVSLVEVKGVTFCGTSDASNLNMSNTPWHHEVVALTKTLKDELALLRECDSNIPEYGLACEHKHSCSVLLARVDHFSAIDENGNRQWRTWIDYDKFQQLAAQHEANPSFTFDVTDYTDETPSWALFGASEEGFDPTDQRHFKNSPKYTAFDADGIPTHDANNTMLSNSERDKLRRLMEEKKAQLGDGSTVTELKGGAKEVLDASLMFRGMVLTK